MRWTDLPSLLERAAHWASAYHRGLRYQPVRSQAKPGDVLQALPPSPPETAEPMAKILADFERIVPQGLTHWRHPRFFAYFPSNASPASVLAEFLASVMNQQAMLWQTSPAATEMETRMLDWLRQGVGLPEGFAGVIQDSASSATLAAVLTMRERALEGKGNAEGLAGRAPLRIYCSAEAHSSVEKAIRVAGIGSANLVRIPISGPLRAMDAEALGAAIAADRAAGMQPIGVIACTGGTSAGACDDLAAACAAAKAEGLYVHVDAAWAGAAMLCPEFRDLWTGVEQADSIVLNPHKWLGAQFDCSAHFVRDSTSLIDALSIQPEYLRTYGAEGIVNYSEWCVPLGRRFRALKLWFLMRAYGLEGIRAMLRDHVRWSQALAARLGSEADFEIVTEPVLSLFTFRYAPQGAGDLDDLNLRLVNAINDDGRIYITQTRIDDKLVIRFQVGAFDAEEADVAGAFDVITEVASKQEI